MRRLVNEAAAVELLRLGEVVAAATESSFGLLADARNPRALDRLFACKPRQSGGVGLILPTFAAWSGWVEGVPHDARLLAEAFWPGALTLALPAQRHVDPRLCQAGTIAVRVAGACSAQRLAVASGLTLTATSANAPRAAPALDHASVVKDLPGAWAVYGHAPGGAPSALIGFQGGAARILRSGRITAQALGQVVPLDSAASSY